VIQFLLYLRDGPSRPHARTSPTNPRTATGGGGAGRRRGALAEVKGELNRHPWRFKVDMEQERPAASRRTLNTKK